MNQARSAFAQAVIAKHFPAIEVTSTGVSAVVGSAYLSEVVGVARRWGVDLPNGFSRALGKNDELLACNLVICAEESMLENPELLGFSGNAISYEQVVNDASFMPRDPAGLRGRYLESELRLS